MEAEQEVRSTRQVIVPVFRGLRPVEGLGFQELGFMAWGVTVLGRGASGFKVSDCFGCRVSDTGVRV